MTPKQAKTQLLKSIENSGENVTVNTSLLRLALTEEPPVDPTDDTNAAVLPITTPTDQQPNQKPRKRRTKKAA